MTGEAGAMTPLLAGVAAVVVLLTVVIADVAAYVTVGLQAATAADAAALAAAPHTYAGSGAGGTPRLAAARFAAANRGELVSCICPIDDSPRARVVEVIVARRVDLSILGRRVVHAVGRAEFVPAAPP